MNAAQKPVTILTGFLGAGKTTFLNHFLRERAETRFAVIENEFGEQGIDGGLVLGAEDTIVELNQGCLCCTLNDNLYDILNDLFDRRAEFDEIIIEATGVADPTGLAQPFLTHPAVKTYFPLRGVICLVDAELIEDHLEETEEARNQVAYSDVLLVNKTDLVAPTYARQVAERLQQLNPLAQVVLGNKAAFPTITLQPGKSPLDTLFKQAQVPASTPESTQFPVAKPHTHHHHSHTEEIGSHTCWFQQPFDLDKLNQQLFVYLMLQAKGLYRIKGLVWVAGAEEPYLVQSVGQRFEITKSAVTVPGAEKRSVLVFIGKHLQRNDLEALLETCLSNLNLIQS